MKKTKLDDDFYSYLVDGARLEGKSGIPMLMDLKNIEIPKGLIPFEKAKKGIYKDRHIHFYMHDKFFSDVLTSTTKYLDLFKQYAGVISPDCSMLVGQARCLQETNTYFNRAVGFYLQKNGIPVIPNIRWSDEESFEFAFLGVPKKSIVSISTHGCIMARPEKSRFKKGLYAMLEYLEPIDVIVHGRHPDCIFKEFNKYTNFHFFQSWLQETYDRRGK